MSSLENGFKINPEDLSFGLRAVLYSAATSGVKPELSSVYFYAEGEELVFVSTDSFRASQSFKGVCEEERTFILAVAKAQLAVTPGFLGTAKNGQFAPSAIII